MGNIKKYKGQEENWEVQQPYIYWMTNTKGIGSLTIGKLIKHAGSPKAVYEMAPQDMGKIIPPNKAAALEAAKEKGTVIEQYSRLKEKNIGFYSIYHPDYPRRLKNIPDRPYAIYVEGTLPKEETPSIAVIGARQCSDYGRFMARQCGRELAEAGINVISGLARGIDGISQKAALEAGGRTYAVLGCGTNICYPGENRFVYERAKENGAVISEYPPDTPPAPGLFPRRNRIISGLADLVLIIEARTKSGTLITADMALEQGKEVYVLPGRVTDPLSQGCNQMLKQGAGLFTSVAGLLEETGLLVGKKWENVTQQNDFNQQDVLCGKMSGEEDKTVRKVLDALDFYPKDTECLMQETQMEYRALICILSRLCLDGRAARVSADQFIKKV